MKIKELHLTNFRGFDQLDIEFKNRLAVFIGVNGAGKSAVLDAICIYFLQLVHGITGNARFGEINYNMESDIKDNEDFFEISFELEHLQLKDLILSIQFAKNPGTPYTAHYGKPMKDFFKMAYSAPNFINAAFNAPIFIHFQSSKEEENKIIKHPLSVIIPQYLAYDNSFFHSINNFADFVNWFKIETDREKDMIIAKQNFNAKNFRLEVIRNTISTFLKYLNGKIPFSDLKVNLGTTLSTRYEFKVNEYHYLTIKKGDKVFNLSQLSEGEKIMLMLVCDIARRLTIANPSLENPLEGEGIVLIDEIDLHLHPQWQREVIPALLATFPNLQFIVTTHSPQVLSKVEKDSIYILEEGKLVKDVPYTYGRNASAILFEIFGVTDRPVDIQNKINKCAQLLEEEKYDKAKVLLNELTNLLGEHDEAVVGARTQLLFNNQLVD